MSNNGILQAFRAEALLAEADILIRIDNLRKGLQYPTEGQQVSFDDYLFTLREAVDAIPKLELDSDVAPGTENQYSIQLVTSMEQIVDDCDRVLRKLAHFQGRLRDAERQINNLKAEFVAWYLLAASSLIAGLDDVKLPSKELRQLADAEFSRLMSNIDLRILSILEDLKLEFERVAQHKTTQKDKHNLGKDQANASWTSTLPSFGNSIPENEPTAKLNRPQVVDDDDEGVPAFISRKPRVTDVQGDVQERLNKAKPGDTVVIRNVENVAPKIAEIKDKPRVSIDDASVEEWDEAATTIKGTFKKTMTAAAEVVKNEQGEPVIETMEDLAFAINEESKPKLSPRKRLILDEEVL